MSLGVKVYTVAPRPKNKSESHHEKLDFIVRITSWNGANRIGNVFVQRTFLWSVYAHMCVCVCVAKRDCAEMEEKRFEKKNTFTTGFEISRYKYHFWFYLIHFKINHDYNMCMDWWIIDSARHSRLKKSKTRLIDKFFFLWMHCLIS